jgi:farnesyl diphosphate synthase
VTTEFDNWSRHWLSHVEQALGNFLPCANDATSELHTAMRYVVLGGGKRIRPLLAFAAGETLQARPEHVTIVACAVELIHAYSLVHDDLPCMDNDVLRRGKPTCHIAFGEATALLVGDSLQSLAFELLAHHVLAQSVQPLPQIEMIRLLATASGAHGMAGGQAIDLANTERHIRLPELELMHQYKTGALIDAAICLGAMCGGSPEAGHLAALKQYAHAVGLAFQVVDDVLDATASSEQLGKTAGKDADQHKSTYVSLMGCDAARQFAHSLHQQAIAAIEHLPHNQRLLDLAALILQRTS